MKRKILLVWVGLALLAVLTMAPASASARATRVDFTGSEVPVELVDEGIWTFLPSGHIRVRGMTTVYQETATDWRMSGRNTSVMNANWGPDFAGPMWGTSESVLLDSADCPGGGVWRGRWTGKMNVDGSYSYRAMGQGVSGCVKGQLFALIAVNPGGNAPTTYSGQILEPHGR